jgi:hypothetical protein
MMGSMHSLIGIENKVYLIKSRNVAVGYFREITENIDKVCKIYISRKELIVLLANKQAKKEAEVARGVDQCLQLITLFSNCPLLGAVGLSMTLVAGIIHIPSLQGIFGTMPLGVTEWLLAFGVAGITSIADLAIENIWDRVQLKNEKVLEPCRPAPMPIL